MRRNPPTASPVRRAVVLALLRWQTESTPGARAPTEATDGADRDTDATNRPPMHADTALARELDRIAPLPAREIALATEIFLGTVRWLRAIDWFVARQTRRRPRPAVREILRTACYQAIFLDRVPDHAVAAEATALASEMEPGAVPIVNAVTRAWLRRRDRLADELRTLQSHSPAVGWSHPSMLVRRWTHRFGREATEALLAWNNVPPPLAARVATGDPEAVADELAAAGIDTRPSPADPRFLRIDAPAAALTATEPWARGALYVQDESTIKPVDLLDAATGERILDLCAAPGGKTAPIAAAVGDRGRVVAVEPDPARIGRLRDNVARLRLDDRVEVVAGDGRDAAVAPGPFDAALVDAPCTNTGVLRRRADARWRFSQTELDAATDLQDRLLDAAAARLRPGGRLVYATCSIEPEENDDRVARFLARVPGFRETGRVETVPPAADHDGLFAARLERTA